MYIMWWLHYINKVIVQISKKIGHSLHKPLFLSETIDLLAEKQNSLDFTNTISNRIKFTEARRKTCNIFFMSIYCVCSTGCVNWHASIMSNCRISLCQIGFWSLFEVTQLLSAVFPDFLRATECSPFYSLILSVFKCVWKQDQNFISPHYPF